VEADFKTTVPLKEDLLKHFDFVHKRLMIALFINDAVLHGESAPFATQAVSMKVLMHRYLMNRTMLENTIKEKIFLPIAVHRNFVERTTAELAHNVRTSTRYVLPRFFYNQKLNLMNNSAEQEMLIRMRDKQEIPLETLADMFGWDLENLKAAFEREQHTPLDPVWRDARKEAVKDVRIRNQVLDGTKLEEITLFDDTTGKPQPGRPEKPDEEKSKAIPSIVPMGPGEAASRAKGTEKGTIPAPKTPAEAGAPPAPGSTTATPPEAATEVPKP
jgi:hypothetical protein